MKSNNALLKITLDSFQAYFFQVLFCSLIFGLSSIFNNALHAQCITTLKISNTEGGLSTVLEDEDDFGTSMASLGDFDGDGILDVVVGAIGDSGGGTNRGAVYILLLNADGTVKAEQKISNTTGGLSPVLLDDDSFGSAVANLGDLDGDGITDIAVGAGGDDDGGNVRGAVYILFLNADGTVKAQQKISDTEGNLMGGLDDIAVFGAAIANIGDLDGDGVTEIAVGAWRDSDGGFWRGAVFVLFLNTDGTVKAEQKISDTEGGLSTALENTAFFGGSVTSVGDLDGDGVTDIAVGAFGGTEGGSVFILFLNADGTVKSEQVIGDAKGGLSEPLDGTTFGYAITNMGDLDGDGNTDITVGSYNGAVYILLLNADGMVKAEQTISATQGELSATLVTSDIFGSAVANIGDLDGDGKTNMAVGAFGDDNSKGAFYIMDVEIISGKPALQAEAPGSIINTISAASTMGCLNDFIPAINNASFDLVSEVGSSAFDGFEIGVFQWQVSYDGTNWEDIADATTSDLTIPIEFLGTTYIRRTFFEDCSNVTSYSNEIIITQSGESPEVSVMPLYYCPGAGQSAMIDIMESGGTGPFIYSWSPTTGLSDATIANPIVTFGSSDLYTLTVTGSDGCLATASAIMIPIQADAGGTTTYICHPNGVEIGMSAIPGLSGVTYSWSPTNDLSCTDCPNPTANPSSSTTYTLTINDGNGCTNSSQITVVPDAYQADAGADVYVCRGTDVQIGTAAQTGITYGWAPGLYVDSITIAQPTFFSGVVPSSNPYTYTLTTFDPNNGDCYSVDTLLAHVAWADAGLDDTTTVCLEPELIGTPDCCNGQATYEWTIVSGDANSFYDTLTGTFSNTSNLPQPSVLPTTTLTTYQVRVTWGPNGDNSGGADCTDLRYIKPGCGPGCPVIDVTFVNDVSCGVGTAGTIMEVPLDTAYWTIDWSPTTNLSCANCANPSLLADVNTDITYMVNYTSRIDPSVSCFLNVDVYDSNTAPPTPLAQGGVVCTGIGLQIGNAPTAGWSYEWTPATGLDDATSSNPTATPTVTTNYTLTVTDDVTGCKSDTTITVALLDLTGVTGGNKSVCTGETMVIGSPAISNYTYSWSPSTGLDDATIAQPTATVNSTQTYTLTVTSPNNCTFSESVTLEAITNFTVTVDDISICDNGTGTLSAKVAGVAESDLLYSWSPATGLSSTSVASPTVSNLSSTQVYSVSVTSTAGGCEGTTTATVTVNAAPDVTLTDVDLCNGSVEIGTANVAGNTYSWTPTVGLDDPTISNPNSSIGMTTTYTLTILDVNNCSNSFTQTVNVQGPQVAAGKDLTVCEETAVSIGAIPAAAGVTYAWTPTDYLDDPTAAQTIARPLASITYTLTASSGGCTSIDTVAITVTPGPTNVGTLDPFAIICKSDCQTIGIPNNAAYSYQWLPAAAVSSPTASMTEICPTENTTVSLKVTDLATGCTKTQKMAIYVTTGGDCPVICTEINELITDRTICSGGTIDSLAVLTTFSNPDSIAFVYFTSQQTDSSLIYTNGIGIDTAQIVNGNDTVGIFNINGFTNTTTTDTFYIYAIAHPTPADNTCRPYEEILVIIEKPTASVFAIQPSCDNNVVQSDGFLQIFAIASGDKYNWVTGSDYIAGGGDPDYADALTIGALPFKFNEGISNPTGSQDYTVRIFNSNGCFTDYTVTMNQQDCMVGCNCTDYMILNDPADDTNGFVHKFKINSDSTFTEIFSNPPTNTLPWIPPGAGLNSPHGLGVDLNGFYYIGGSGSGIRKIDCDGNLFPTSDFHLTEFSYNLTSHNGILYSNPDYSSDDVRITAYDPCDGSLIGFIKLDTTGVLGREDWGFEINEEGKFYVTSGFGAQEKEGKHFIYAFTPTLADFTANTTYSPIISSDAFPTISNRTDLFGITSDPSGNIYVALWDYCEDWACFATFNTWILKFSSSGTLLAQTFEPGDGVNGGIGYNGARGIKYYDELGLLFLSGLDDCVAIVNPNDLSYIGTGVGYVAGQNPKALAIVTECCPTNNNITVDTALCATSVGENLFLQEFINCTGTICEGNWKADAGNTGITFNACDNSISINNTSACGTFTLESDGSGKNPQCGAFKITVNILVGNVTAPIIAGNQTVCLGGDPEVFTVTTPASGSNTVTYQWQSTTDTLATYTNIVGAIDSVYNPQIGVMDTTYYRVISSVSDNCSSSTCADTSNSIVVYVVNCDYGDLPDIANGTTGIRDYETFDSTGGPSHQIIVGLFLGDTVDVDIDGVPDTLAVGDDNKDGYDDEDGISIFPSLNIRPGGTIRLPLSVTNTTGDTAYIEAWIDWNGDGDFNETNEMVVDYKDNKDGVFPNFMDISVPKNVTIGSLLGFRVRLSNTDNMTPYGRINSGEIEDYLIGIECPQVICLPITSTLIRKE